MRCYKVTPSNQKLRPPLTVDSKDQQWCRYFGHRRYLRVLCHSHSLIIATLKSSTWGIPRSERIYIIPTVSSGCSLGFPWVSYQWDMPRTPVKGGVQGTSRWPNHLSWVFSTWRSRYFSKSILDKWTPHPTLTQGRVQFLFGENQLGRLFPDILFFLSLPRNHDRMWG